MMNLLVKLKGKVSATETYENHWEQSWRQKDVENAAVSEIHCKLRFLRISQIYLQDFS